VKRVFVVEDEAIVALEIKDHLREHGFAVCGYAGTGEAALRQIPVARPDLILMDVNLGKGLSGFEVAEQLWADIDVPVLFLSAYSDEQRTNRAVHTGTVGFLTKPFDPRMLAAAIERLIAMKE
jgi:DNA-binding response OmpR family regulator